MKTLTVLIILLIASIPARAQIRFQHLMGGAAYEDVQEVIQTPDHGFIMCGTTESFGAGQSDILVIKTDQAGMVQWSNTYGSSGNDYSVAVRIAPAGGYVIAGYSYGLSADTLTDDFLLLNIDTAGNVNWVKTYGGVDNDESHALAVMADSGFVIAGTTSSFGGVSGQAGYVVRTDAAGNKLWSKAIAQNSDQQLFSVDATADGGCIVAGYTYVSSFRLFDVFIAKISASGVKQWVRSYGGNNSEQAFSIRLASTGGYVVSGYTSSFGTGQEDAFILRIDDTGNVSWFNTYGTAASERSRSVIWNSAGIVISGHAQVGANLFDNNFLLQTDTAGIVLWSRTYGPTSNVSLPYSASECSDGGFITGGLTGGFGALQNDIYLIKTNDLGGSGCNQASPQLFASGFLPSDSSGGTFTNGGTENTVTINQSQALLTTHINCNSTISGTEERGYGSISVTPNPATDFIRIGLNDSRQTESGLSIIDLQGNILYKAEYPAIMREMIIPVTAFTNGLYILKLVTGNGVHTRKMIISR